MERREEGSSGQEGLLRRGGPGSSGCDLSDLTLPPHRASRGWCLSWSTPTLRFIDPSPASVPPCPLPHANTNNKKSSGSSCHYQSSYMPGAAPSSLIPYKFPSRSHAPLLFILSTLWSAIIEVQRGKATCPAPHPGLPSRST